MSKAGVSRTKTILSSAYSDDFLFSSSDRAADSYLSLFPKELSAEYADPGVPSLVKLETSSEDGAGELWPVPSYPWQVDCPAETEMPAGLAEKHDPLTFETCKLRWLIGKVIAMIDASPYKDMRAGTPLELPSEPTKDIFIRFPYKRQGDALVFSEEPNASCVTDSRTLLEGFLKDAQRWTMPAVLRAIAFGLDAYTGCRYGLLPISGKTRDEQAAILRDQSQAKGGDPIAWFNQFYHIVMIENLGALHPVAQADLVWSKGGSKLETAHFLEGRFVPRYLLEVTDGFSRADGVLRDPIAHFAHDAEHAVDRMMQGDAGSLRLAHRVYERRLDTGCEHHAELAILTDNTYRSDQLGGASEALRITNSMRLLYDDPVFRQSWVADREAWWSSFISWRGLGEMPDMSRERTFVDVPFRLQAFRSGRRTRSTLGFQLQGYSGRFVLWPYLCSLRPEKHLPRERQSLGGIYQEPNTVYLTQDMVMQPLPPVSLPGTHDDCKTNPPQF